MRFVLLMLLPSMIGVTYFIDGCELPWYSDYCERFDVCAYPMAPVAETPGDEPATKKDDSLPELPPVEALEADVVAMIFDLANGDEEQRIAAIHGLVDLPQWTEYALPELTAALADASADVRRAAAHILADLGPRAEPATKALIAAMRDPERGEFAGWALSQIGRPAVRPLRRTLGAPLPTARSAAAYALGAMGCKALPARPALRRARNDPSKNVRRQVRLALRRLGPCQVITWRRYASARAVR